MTQNCQYGTHRVIEPANVLPQTANKIDNSLPIRSNELLVEVDTLNIDSASFTQMKKACGGDLKKVGEMICEIVAERGKQQNPVTGSGGMLLGTVKEIGADYTNTAGLAIGDKMASLVSLSLTPLKIEEIIEIFPERDQVKIKGHAIFFPTGPVAKIPADMDEILALAVLDVAGAPAQAKKLVKKDQTVVIIGAGGKSGVICAAVARDILGDTGKLIAIQPSAKGQARCKELGVFDHILGVDATDPVTVQRAVSEVTNGEMADLVINVASVQNIEMSSIMAAKNDGTVYLFSMATNFAKAALGAEGIGSDALLIVGNGYAPGHADLSLEIIRKNKKLREMFEQVYC